MVRLASLLLNVYCKCFDTLEILPFRFAILLCLPPLTVSSHLSIAQSEEAGNSLQDIARFPMLWGALTFTWVTDLG